tara:strand:+ start:3007 stop:4170 length:1164 start_codon:yes stop_codon:yes gene_type:complete
MSTSIINNIHNLKLIEKFNDKIDINFGYGVEFNLELPQDKVILITSPSLDEKFLKNFIDHYEKLGTSFTKVKKSTGEPWSCDIDRTYSKIDEPVFGIVGIGGGSVLDFAKALAILILNNKNIDQYEFGDEQIRKVASMWLIPTTCGSGSEVSKYCVVNNTQTGRKFTISNDLLKPKQIAVNPQQLKLLTNDVRLETGLDAFTHCLEALLNSNRDKRLDPVAEEGVKIACRILPRVAKQDTSVEILEDLAILSLLGGTAITYNRTGLIHTLSVAFAPLMKMSHGLLNSHLVYYALKFSLSSYHGRLRDVCSLMFEKDIISDEDGFNILIHWLDEVKGKNKFISEKSIHTDCDKIVDRIFQDKGLADVTHGQLDKKSILDTVKKILEEV